MLLLCTQDGAVSVMYNLHAPVWDVRRYDYCGTPRLIREIKQLIVPVRIIVHAALFVHAVSGSIWFFAIRKLKMFLL